MRGMTVYCRMAPRATSCGRFATSAKSCGRIHYHHSVRYMISLREHPLKHIIALAGRSLIPSLSLPLPRSSNPQPERFLGCALSILLRHFQVHALSLRA